MNKQKAYELRLNICLQIESLKDDDPDRISWRAIKFRSAKLTRSRSTSRRDDWKSGFEVDQERQQIGNCFGISERRDLAVLHCIRSCGLLAHNHS